VRGINPKYLEKLDEAQRKTAISGPGKFFLDSFVFVKGEHGYIVGPTGSGKTNKGMGLVNWLKHTETIIWISSGKDNETIPLLFMGLPVRIITPKYHDVKIFKGRELYEHQPEVVQVPDAGSAWWAVKKGCINIFEFRNAFWDKSELIKWIVELFEVLAMWTRLNMMPKIAPAAIFIDESKYIMAGTRVTKEGTRIRASEIITENVMDIRAYGFRLVIFVQDFIDSPPAIRENLPCVFLCSGSIVDTIQKLRQHCTPRVPGWKSTTQYKRNEAKFINRQGKASPQSRPVKWPLFPKSEEDYELSQKLRVKDIGFHDRPPEEAEAEEELFPELGRFSHLAIPPKKTPVPEHSRWQVVENDN